MQALSKMASEYQYDFSVLDAVMAVNEKQRMVIGEKIKAYFGESIKGKRIAIWGLAFKPNTDDIREAPAIYTINMLLEAGAEIVAFDPEGMPNIKKLFGDKIRLVANEYDALIGANALAIITEWTEFRTPDLDRMAELMKAKIIFDGRNLYNLKTLQEAGWYYNSIGRQVVNG